MFKRSEVPTNQSYYTTWAKNSEQYPDAKAPVFFRPPKGRVSEKVLSVTKDCGLRTTMWSIAIVDWGKKPIDAASNAKKIASRVHPGAVLLSHITNAGTPAMLRLLIPMLSEKGYTIGIIKFLLLSSMRQFKTTTISRSDTSTGYTRSLRVYI